MATSSEFNETQLQAARTSLWHQAGDPVVTLEDAQSFLEKFGLVPFAPAKLAMVAPSLVEATLGAENKSPSTAESQVARELVGRMTADGSGLPLNLIGGPGDTPDFVVSGTALKFIFTLRGDKNWKKAPETSGATKVSPLALRCFEVLTERGAMTAAELASELGREVTETAIVRALSELWQGLRVVPLLQPGEAATLWELTAKRFTRAIKAGMNAGQPTALSALISLYLQQTLVATEDEIETFLSPLAARSRVREVLHALRAARELNEVVVAGKTLLHVAGDLPEFAPIVVEPQFDEEGNQLAAPIVPKEKFQVSETEAPEPGRIKKFAAPAGPRTREGGKVAFKRAARPDGEARPEKERRPFARKSAPDFSKPWDEEKESRRAPGGEDATERPARKSFGAKPAFGARKSFGDRKPYVRRDDSEGGERKPFAPRKSFGAKPAFGARKSFGDKKPFGAKPAFGDRKPFVRRDDSEGGERKPYARKSFGDKPAFGARKPFGAKPAFGDRKPFVRRDDSEGGERKPFAPRKSFGDKPSFGARKPFGDKKPFGAKPFGERKPFVRRDDSESGERKPFARKSFGDKPAFGARKPFGDKKPFGAKPFGERKPFVKREDFETGERPARKPFGAKPSFGARKPFGGERSGGNFKARSSAPKKKAYGADKLFDKKGPLPAPGEGGLSPTGSKRKRRTEE